MDLVDENRILVKDGLRRLQNPENEGLKALIRVNNLENREITAYHIGFVLGPCMNASGRLSTAKRALQLLLSQDVKEASVLAEDLKNLNDSRKDMTAKGVEQAVELVETTDLLMTGCWLSICRIVMKAWPGLLPGESGRDTHGRYLY